MRPRRQRPGGVVCEGEQAHKQTSAKHHRAGAPAAARRARCCEACRSAPTAPAGARLRGCGGVRRFTAPTETRVGSRRRGLSLAQGGALRGAGASCARAQIPPPLQKKTRTRASRYVRCICASRLCGVSHPPREEHGPRVADKEAVQRGQDARLAAADGADHHDEGAGLHLCGNGEARTRGRAGGRGSGRPQRRRPRPSEGTPAARGGSSARGGRWRKGFKRGVCVRARQS